MTDWSKTISRRAVLGAFGAIGAGLSVDDGPGALAQEQGRARPNGVAPVKALVFDVFGTVVDWRTSIAREVEALAKRKGLSVDGAKFADAWRAEYGPSMNRVRSGEMPWTKLDDLHRKVLDKLVVDFAIAGLSEAEIGDPQSGLASAYSPGRDVVDGLTRLKKKFIIAPLSNGNIALMTNLAKYSGLPWDCILGAELVRHYKPDREVYQSAADFLNLTPAEVMMVAAHLGDLRAAKGVGLKTAFVPRPLEYGQSRTARPHSGFVS